VKVKNRLASFHYCARSSIPASRRPKYFDAGLFHLCGLGHKWEGYDFFFFSKGSLNEAINYTPKDDDLFVVTYLKNGTTWTKQILYCLLNGEKTGHPPHAAQKLSLSFPGSTVIEWS
jgi:hypothetical protein